MLSAAMDDFTDNLNDAQKLAVQTTEGHVRVIAGPGTGKTQTLTSRYCYLVSTLGISPRNILCVTFTNRAANEMKSRVRKMIGDLDLGYICTFHAFCVQFLKEEIYVLNFPKNFIIIDTEDEKDILKKIFEDMHLTMKDTTYQKTIDNVLEAKKMAVEGYIDDILLLDNEKIKEKFEAETDRDNAIFLRYIYETKKNFACDFNDLINYTTYILENFPAIREKWQDIMQYVLIDEFQDVSMKQYTIGMILSKKHGNLFIVGDPDQTIYTWRGSHLKMLLNFDKDYPDSKTIELQKNYRSTGQILDVSDRIIRNNATRFPKHLIPTVGDGPKPLYYHAKDEKEEAEWIAGRVEQFHLAGLPYSKCAILYRAHYLTRPLEEALIKKSIPYKIFSGTEFYARMEIKDIICYLRMVTSGDDIAFLRTVNVPSRKMGKKKVEFLKDFALKRGMPLYDALKQTIGNPLFRGTGAARYIDSIEFVRKEHFKMSLSDATQTLLDRSGYEEYLRQQGDQERLDNVAELKRGIDEASKDDDASMEDFVAKVALLTNLDKEDDDTNDCCKLMTIHTAKGMEFPVVFLCGLNEGVFPSRKTFTPEDMEEERRLCYVALTRAKGRLFLSDSEGLGNDGLYKLPSRFIFEAGDAIDYDHPLDSAMIDKTMRFIHDNTDELNLKNSLFSEGDVVKHPVFGCGVIKSVDIKNNAYNILFEGFSTERSIRFGTQLEKEPSDLPES
jgi:DNA helicase-2/ATP-dependent DNA helicase PcrA